MSRAFEEAFAFHALRAAALRAARRHRAEPEAAEFLSDLERNVLRLSRELMDDTWRPGPMRRFTIREPKARSVSVLPFGDRVVHHALIGAVSPRWEELAVGNSYACRVGKGVHRAVARARGLCQHWTHYLKLDVRHFFETVDHEVVRDLLVRVVPDPQLRGLFDPILRAGAAVPGRGLPIGSLTSQHLANLLLGRVDRFALRTLRRAVGRRKGPFGTHEARRWGRTRVDGGPTRGVGGGLATPVEVQNAYALGGWSFALPEGWDEPLDDFADWR